MLILKRINPGRISLLFFFLLIAACNRSAAPATSIPAVPPAPTHILATEEIPTLIPTLGGTPTTVVLTLVEPTLAPENATNLRQTAATAYDNPSRLVWSQDGQYVALMSGSGLVVLDGKTLELVSRVEVTEPLYLLDFSPTSNRMATTVDQQVIEIRDIASGTVTQTLPLDAPLLSASFSPDGLTLAVFMSNEIAVKIWDITNGELKQTVTGFETAAPVYSGFIGPDGKHFVWLSRGTVQVADLETGEYGAVIGHEDFVSAAALSLDGAVLATAAGGTLNGYFQALIKLWDPSSGEEKAAIPAGDLNPAALSFSPDGRLLASNDGSLLTLWDVNAGQQIGAVSGHEDSITSVAFSPDGLRIASTAVNGTIRIWQVGP